jgi:large subunit ribosomal protein L3
MVSKLLGKKIGMTRFFVEEGRSVPVTVLKLGPCVVLQKKTKAKEGYNAIQLGFDPQKESRVNKPMKGHFKGAGGQCFKEVKEVHVEDPDSFELGQEIGSDVFSIGDLVSVAANSKGRGFMGVVKRWGFHGGKKTHGSRFHRAPGSIGTNTTPGRVHKGRKLPGRMGNERVTIKNLVVIDVRPEMNLVLVRGSVPGHKNGFLEVMRVGRAFRAEEV